MVLSYLNKTVYVFIDELSRDSIVASALSAYLCRKGFRVFFGSRNDVGFFAKFKSPFDFHIFPSVLFFREMAGSFEERSIGILPAESVSSGNEQSKLRLEQHFIGVDTLGRADASLIFNKVAVYFLWGNAHKEIIEKISEDLGCEAIVVGHPRHDRLCGGFPEKRRGARPSDKKKIGLVTRFDLLNPFDNRTQLSMAYVHRNIRGESKGYFNAPGKDIENMWFTNVADLNSIFKVLDQIDLTRFDVSIRVHPRESYGAWVEMLSLLPKGIDLSGHLLPFTHWAADMDFIISPPSTSFYDYALKELKAINSCNLCSERMSHALSSSDDLDPILKYYPAPFSISDLLSLIEKYPTQRQSTETKDLRALLSREVGSPVHINSLSSVADWVDSRLYRPISFKRIISMACFIIYREYRNLAFMVVRRPQSSAYYSLKWSTRNFIKNLIAKKEINS